MSAPSPEPGRQFLDEALRLLDLAQARRQAPARQDAARASDSAAAAECCVCPVCRGIAMMREIDPQGVEKLTGAVADMAAAVRALIGGAREDTAAGGGVPGEDRSAPQEGVPRIGVQQIDVTD